MRVGGEHLPEQRRHIGMEFEVMLDGTVEQRRGFRAVGRERQAAFVTNHRRSSAKPDSVRSEWYRPWSSDASAGGAADRNPGWRDAARCNCPTAADRQAATGGDR